MVTLRQPLSLEECEQIRLWRNSPDVYPMLRTGYLTEEQQLRFYITVIRDPGAPHLYYAIEADGIFAGVGGLTYLHRIPWHTEISLVLGPRFRGHGVGTLTVDLLLKKAWALGMWYVDGECYWKSPALGFWQHMWHTFAPRTGLNLTEEAYCFGWRRPEAA
jgi:RimJ/RimL family protein N-acetyltransferase